MSEPRQHHILPEFYLAGFTDTGTRDGMLHVFDYRRGKRYRAKPRQVARERDFYRVYEPGYHPNVIENDFAALESELAPALRRVLKDRIVNGPEELGRLLSLVALIHARNLKGRERLSLAMEHTMRERLETGDVSEAEWQQLVESEIRAGVDPSDLPSYQEAGRLVKEGIWSPTAPKVLQVGLIAQTQQLILDALIPHHWSLAVTASSDKGGFICSDSPLSWSAVEPWEPGFTTDEPLDNPSVHVMFPLSKGAALITRNYDRHKKRRYSYEATDKVIAWVNSRTHMFSYSGTLYSASEDFLLLQKGNKLGHSKGYFAHTDKMRRAAPPRT